MYVIYNSSIHLTLLNLKNLLFKSAQTRWFKRMQKNSSHQYRHNKMWYKKKSHNASRQVLSFLSLLVFFRLFQHVKFNKVCGSVIAHYWCLKSTRSIAVFISFNLHWSALSQKCLSRKTVCETEYCQLTLRLFLICANQVEVNHVSANASIIWAARSGLFAANENCTSSEMQRWIIWSIRPGALETHCFSQPWNVNNILNAVMLFLSL